MPNQRPIHRAPVRPDRVRRINGGFAFVPNGFIHRGFFSSLTHTERSLYFFLVLASDRNGLSFYSYDRICSIAEMAPDEYLAARNSLIAKDLIAFDGTRFQVLSLPAAPVVHDPPALVSEDDFESHDPATIRELIRASLEQG